MDTVEELQFRRLFIETMVGDLDSFRARGERGELTHGDVPLYQDLVSIEEQLTCHA